MARLSRRAGREGTVACAGAVTPALRNGHAGFCVRSRHVNDRSTSFRHDGESVGEGRMMGRLPTSERPRSLSLGAEAVRVSSGTLRGVVRAEHQRLTPEGRPPTVGGSAAPWRMHRRQRRPDRFSVAGSSIGARPIHVRLAMLAWRRMPRMDSLHMVDRPFPAPIGDHRKRFFANARPDSDLRCRSAAAKQRRLVGAVGIEPTTSPV